MLKTQKEHTFSVYPQQRVGGLPLIEYTALEEPFSGAVMMSFAGDVVIDGWIWGRKPSQKTISKLVSCADD